MLAPKQGLPVAPVPPKTADLTRPARGAGTMAGRDEGTGALIEPRNNRAQASRSCRNHHLSLTICHPIVGETEQASHTEIRILPAVGVGKPGDREGFLVRKLTKFEIFALSHVQRVAFL